MNSSIKRATFWEHIEELRLTLLKMIVVILVGTLISFLYYHEIFSLICYPLNQELVVLGPIDGFSTILKLSFWVGFFMTSPLWIYFLLGFISPGLTEKERSAIPTFFCLSILFSGIGILFGFTITIPFANKFLSLFNEGLGQNLWSLQNYLDYTITLLLAHGVVFEFAALLLVLIHFGFIKEQLLSKKRPYAYLTISIIAAILTPPDVLTQLMLGAPMCLLYECLILYGKTKENST